MISRKVQGQGQDLSSHNLDNSSSSKDSLKKYIKIKSEIVTGEIMLKMTENNTRSKTNMGIVAPHVNTAGPECPKCGQVCKDYSNLKNHVLSHYYKMFYMVLPHCKPFPCPISGHCNRDRITMVRHYAFTHKKIFEMTDVTVQDLHGSVTKISSARGASTSANGAVVASSSKKQNISPMMDDSRDDDEDVKKMKAQLSSFSNKNEDIKVKCRPDSEKNTKKKFCKEKNRSDSEKYTKKKFCTEKNGSDSENDTKKKFCKEKNR